MTDENDRPIGLFGLRFHERERRAHLIRVAISPLWRGEGLSLQLLRGAAALARERRALRVTLNVYGSNADARAAYERDYILKKLDDNHGNISRTAEVLGLERSHLYRKMKTLGIAVKE